MKHCAMQSTFKNSTQANKEASIVSLNSKSFSNGTISNNKSSTVSKSASNNAIPHKSSSNNTISTPQKSLSNDMISVKSEAQIKDIHSLHLNLAELQKSNEAPDSGRLDSARSKNLSKSDDSLTNLTTTEDTSGYSPVIPLFFFFWFVLNNKYRLHLKKSAVEGRIMSTDWYITAVVE